MAATPIAGNLGGSGRGRGVPDREFSPQDRPDRGPHVIAYRAMLDVPRELVVEVARLLRAERRVRGTRKGSRSLTCWYQALLVLVWFRSKCDVAVVGAGFGVSRSTAYRYRDEGVTVLCAQAPDLHEALEEVAAQGWSHVVLDGKVFRCDRCAQPTPARKARRSTRGTPGSTMPSAATWRRSCARTGCRYGSATPRPARPDRRPGSRCPGRAVLGGVPARPDHTGRLGLRRHRPGIKVPVKQPNQGQLLAPDQQTYNSLHRATRCRGERGSR